jgi:hypothetical protein
VLLDPTDDQAVTAGLLTRHDPLAGCVVVHPTPGANGRASLAHDVLAALGRPVEIPPRSRIAREAGAWAAATAWAAADRVAHLVVLRAHRLPAEGWTRLLEFAANVGAEVLLVCHTPTVAAHLRARLPATATVTVTADLAAVARELDAARAQPPRERPPRRQYPDLPRRLPAGQVLHYRADVYRQHFGEIFARVDDLYGRGLDAACNWLRSQPGPPARRPAVVDGALQRLLTELFHDSPTRQHTLAMLRGVQAGFLLHGSWLAMPTLANLCGPGLTSSPITFDVADRIRAGVADPVLAAGVALAMLTGADLLALRSLRLDALPPPGQVLLLPFRRNDAPAAQRHRPVASDATLVFHIPLPARPLIRAARTFLLGRSPDLRQRVFAGMFPLHERIAETAERCGVRLPAHPPYLIDAWLLRVTWTHLDVGVHTNPPGHIGAGRSCLTATPADTMLVPRSALHRHPHDQLRNRWSPRNVPTFLPGLVRAYLDGTEPDLRGYREHYITVPAGGDTTARRRGLVEQHLAVRTAPAGPATSEGGITVHPDIPFALRLSPRPAPPEPDQPYWDDVEQLGDLGDGGLAGFEVAHHGPQTAMAGGGPSQTQPDAAVDGRSGTRAPFHALEPER